VQKLAANMARFTALYNPSKPTSGLVGFHINDDESSTIHVEEVSLQSVWKMEGMSPYADDLDPKYIGKYKLFGISLASIRSDPIRRVAYDIAAPMCQPFVIAQDEIPSGSTYQYAIYFISTEATPQQVATIEKCKQLISACESGYTDTWQCHNNGELLEEVLNHPQDLVDRHQRHMQPLTIADLAPYTADEIATMRSCIAETPGVADSVVQMIDDGALAGVRLSEMEAYVHKHLTDNITPAFALFDQDLLMTPQDAHCMHLHTNTDVNRVYGNLYTTCTTLLQDTAKTGASINANVIWDKELIIAQAHKYRLDQFWTFMWQLGEGGKTVSILCLEDYGYFPATSSSSYYYNTRYILAQQWATGRSPDRGKASLFNHYWPEPSTTAEDYVIPDVGTLHQESNEVVELMTGCSLIKSKYTMHRAASSATHVIYRYWFYTWPDHGVVDVQHLVKLIAYMNNQGDCQWYVHCKAGIGRSGVVGACWCLNKILSAYVSTRHDDANPPLCIPRFLTEMRCRRFFLIQTVEQYRLCYSYILKWYEMNAYLMTGKVRTHEASTVTSGSGADDNNNDDIFLPPTSKK
jgi:protein tyrosine phosphatase